MLDRLIDLILWILVSYGITSGITGSSLLLPVRLKIAKFSKFFGDLINCPLCFGFWVGAFLNLTWLSPTDSIFFDCFLSSCTCWLLYLWENSKM